MKWTGWAVFRVVARTEIGSVFSNAGGHRNVPYFSWNDDKGFFPLAIRSRPAYDRFVTLLFLLFMEHAFTDQSFAQEVLQSSTPVFVDFWAEWCGPCQVMGPIIEELAHEIPETKLKIGKMNVDQNIETPGIYRVMSIPTMIVFQNGQVAETIVGSMSKEALKEKLSRFLA